MFDDDGSLVEGRGVMIPGYPLALGVEDDKNHPVIRLGMIAQFTGKSYFLIDGVASHGNSGSPVFALTYKNPKLVGMVTSYLTDTITLLDEAGNLAAKLPYNSGIARAVKMQVIVDALQKAVGNYQRRRLQSPTPLPRSLHPGRRSDVEVGACREAAQRKAHDGRSNSKCGSAT